MRIDLILPGHELVANRAHSEDVYIALRDAFDNMRRQVVDVTRQRRGQVKQHRPMSPSELEEAGDNGARTV